MQCGLLFEIFFRTVTVSHLQALLREHHLNTVKLLCQSLNNYTEFETLVTQHYFAC